MKKLVLTGILGIFVLGMTSCGHILCDAYREADYTKYKSEQTKKIVLNIDFNVKKNK
jgi:hypothetical protein